MFLSIFLLLFLNGHTEVPSVKRGGPMGFEKGATGPPDVIADQVRDEGLADVAVTFVSAFGEGLRGNGAAHVVLHGDGLDGSGITQSEC